MENENIVSEAIVEKVSISAIKAEQTAIQDESDAAIIDEILLKITEMADEEKDEMIEYLKRRNAKLKNEIAEFKKKKAGV
jgi:hypothetical protein